MTDNQDFKFTIDKYFDKLVGFILKNSTDKIDNNLHNITIVSIKNHLNTSHQAE